MNTPTSVKFSRGLCMTFTSSCHEAREESNQRGEGIRDMSAHKGKKKRIGSRRRVVHQNETAEPEELPGTDRAPLAQWHIPEHGPDSPSLLLNPNHSQADSQHASSSEIFENNGGKGSSQQRPESVKDFATEQGHKPTEEVEENMGNETLEVTQRRQAVQDKTLMKLSPTDEHDIVSVTQIYSAPMPEAELEKNVQEETRNDPIQSAADSVQVRENQHLFGTIPSGGLSSHPTFNEQVIDETTMPQKQLPHASNAEIEQLHENKDLSWQDGVNQTKNLASDAHVDLRDMEPLATSEITTEKNSLGKHTEIENIEQAACFSPTVEQVEHSNFPEHSGEVALHENKVALTEVHQTNDSFEQIVHDVKEDADTCSANPMVPATICDREKSDLGVKDSDDSVPTQVLYPSDTQEENLTNTDESQISSTEISDTALNQLHEGEDQGMNYVQLGFKGFLGRVEEGESSLQTVPFGMDVPLESQSEDNRLRSEEQSDKSLNPMKNRRKFGSRRRNKGSYAKESADVSHESPEDIAGYVRDETPFDTEEMSFTSETGVQEEVCDPVKENVPLGISDSTSSKNKDEKEPENLQFVEEFTYSSPKKEEQTELFNFLEVKASQSSHDGDNNVPAHSDICDTNASELIVKSIDDPATQQEALNPVDKQEEHNTKVNVAVLDQRDENPPNTEETQISSTEVPGSALSQVHEGKDQDVKNTKVLYNRDMQEESVETVVEDMDKLDITQAEGVNDGIKESTPDSISEFTSSNLMPLTEEDPWILVQSDTKEMPNQEIPSVSSETDIENKDGDFSKQPEKSLPRETEVKEDQTEGVHDQVKENVPVGVSEFTSSDLLSISPENKDEKDFSKQHENWQFVDETIFSSQKGEEQSEPFNLLEVKDLESPHESDKSAHDHSDICDTNASEPIVKSIGDSASQQEVLNLDDKQEKHNPKENIMEVLDQRDENPSITEETQISNTERPDTASLQVHEGEEQDVVDVKLSAEGFISGFEKAEASSPTIASEINATLESQSEDNPLKTEEETDNSFNPMRSRRKMGSSRRHKGRGHIKESGAETFHESPEDVAGNIKGEEQSVQTGGSFATETTVQEESLEPMQEMDKLDMSQSDQVKESVGISEFTSSKLLSVSPQQVMIDQSRSDEMQTENNLTGGSVTENKEREEDQELFKESRHVRFLDEIFPSKEGEEHGENFSLFEGKELEIAGDADSDLHDLEIKGPQIHESEHSESNIFDLTESLDSSSANRIVQGEISVKSTADSAAQHKVLNPDDKQQEHHMKDNNMDVLDQREENASNTEESQISSTERTDTSLVQVHDSKDQNMDDVKLSVEGFLGRGEETEISLQTIPLEIGALLKSHEDNPLSTEEETETFNLMKSRRKMGSSRRHKGRGHIKESGADTFHESSEDVAEDISDKDPSEKTQKSFTIETTMQEESVETVVEDMDKLDITQAEGVNDGIKESTPDSISEFTSSNLLPLTEGNTWVLVQSDTKEMPNQEIPSVSSETDIENKNEGFSMQPEKSLPRETEVKEDQTEGVHDQVKENVPVAVSEFTSLDLLSISPENKDEKDFSKQHENWQFVDETIFSSQIGEEQSEPFNLLEVKDLESSHESDKSAHDHSDICDTNASEPIVKSIGDSASQQEVLHLDDKQEKHNPKENIMEVLDQRDENPSITEETQISNTERPDTASLQVHEGEDQDVVDVKLSAEGFISGFEKAETSSPTIASEINATLESQSEDNPLKTEEETDNSFNPMRSRRKMGSSRRHKGRGHIKESGTETFHESSEDVAENISDKDPSETTERSFTTETGVRGESAEPMLKEMDTLVTSQSEVLDKVKETIPVGIQEFTSSNLLSVSPENKDEKEFSKQPENWQFVEEIIFSSQKGEEESKPFHLLEVKDLQSPHDSESNVPDHSDIYDTNPSELIVKSIGDSATQREALNPDDNQDEHPTKEINVEVSDQTDKNASNTEESQISNTERPDTALFQVHAGEDQDVKLGADGLISGVDEALQTIAPEINAPFETQSESNPMSAEEETENSFTPMKSRRKMGSSRRHKGRGHIKESGAETFHESSEDVAKNISDEDPSETTERAFTIEATIQEQTVETVVEDMDKLDITQTEGDNDQIKESTPDSIMPLSEGDPSVLVQSDSKEMPNEELLSTVTDSENKERDEDENLPRHTQDDYNYLESQSLMKAEGVVLANMSETTNEIEYSVEKENMSSPNGKQSAKEEDDEHLKLSRVKDAQPSVGDLNNLYQQEIKPMEMHGAHSSGSSSLEESTSSQTSLAGLESPLDSQSQGNPGLHKLRGNKRKLGSSRRNKGSHVRAESPTEPDVAKNTTGDGSSDTVPFDKMPTEMTETDANSVTEEGKMISIENDKVESKELMQEEDTTLPLNIGDNTSGNGYSLKPTEGEIQIEPDILSHLTGHDSIKVEVVDDSALGDNKETREKELYTVTETEDENKEEQRDADQKDIGERHEDSPDEPFSVSRIKTETLLLLDVGIGEDTSEPAVDSSVDGESPKAENPHKKNPTQTKRKLGSTRRSQLHRKPEEGMDNSDTKEMDFNADVQHFGTMGEAEEAPLIVSAEVLQNQKAEPPLTTVHEVSTDQDLQRKPSSSAPDLISSTENVMSFLAEKPSSLVEEVNHFFQAPDIKDGHAHTGDTLEQQTRQEDINVTQGQDNLEVAAQESKYISEEGDDTEMQSESLNLTNRRRKMGSTRKSLRAARDEENLHHLQGVNNEATDAVTNVDILTESLSGVEEEEEPKANDEHKDSKTSGEKAEQRAGERAVSGQLGEIEHHLAPLSVPSQPDAAPSLDTMSESTPGRRRRKMGSHRKSHGHDTPTETEPGSALKTIMDESLLETQGQRGPDNKSQVEEGSKKSLLNISLSETGELSAPVTRNKAPQHVAAPQHPAVNPGQKREISIAASSTKNSYNVVMVGDSGVGKTSFMKRAQSGKFSMDIPSSIGLDTCMWTVLIDGKPVVLQLWDTAGQERFHSITRQVFHKAQAFLLMYDISSSQTFTAIRYWAECIQEGAMDNVPILLVGNKSDHAKRQVTPEEGETLAKEYNFDFMECSAATGDNVVQSLETVARLLKQRADRREEPLVLLKDTQKKASGCC